GAGRHAGHYTRDAPRRPAGQEAAMRPAGGTLSGSRRHTAYEYAARPSVASRMSPAMIGIDRAGATRALPIVTSPSRMKTQPPARCVRLHDSALDSVHGVRMPKNQFGRSLPSTFPRTTKRAPIVSGITVRTSIAPPRAEAWTRPYAPASRTITATWSVAQAGMKFA